MDPNFWPSHQTGLLGFLGAVLLISLTNLVYLRRLAAYPPLTQYPKLAILVPARDEEANIRACVLSLLAQEYPDFDVWVLNDNSTDATGAILEELAFEFSQLHVINGSPLPEGWLGKLWACHQLSQAAIGELLFFTDADTRHHPKALQQAVSALQCEQADLLTALPTEETHTLGEKLTVPLIPWSLFTFLPVGLAHRLRWSPLSAAIGQFLLFRRSAYEQIGGHAAIRRNAAEDLAMARRILRHGLQWRLADAGERVYCRMYTGFQQAFQGLSKSLFAAFDYRLWLFGPIWLWVGIVFIEPALVSAFALAGHPLPGFSVPLALAAYGIATLQWLIFCLRFRFPLYLAPLHPLIVGVAVVTVIHSAVLTLTGRSTWKGRSLPRSNSF